MALNIPKYFGPHIASVRLAMTLAERGFLDALTRVRVSASADVALDGIVGDDGQVVEGTRHQAQQLVVEVVTDYLTAIVVAFARGACETARDNPRRWDQIATTVETRLADAVRYVFHVLRLPQITAVWPDWSQFDAQVTPRVKERAWPAYLAYQEQLLTDVDAAPTPSRLQEVTEVVPTLDTTGADATGDSGSAIDELSPLQIEEQRRAAVKHKLGQVNRDTDETMREADFVRAAGFQHRKSLTIWYQRGEAYKPAHAKFSATLLLSSPQFVAARKRWRRKRPPD